MKYKNYIKKTFFSFFILFFLQINDSFSITVLIDPGHGGNETGAQVRFGQGKSAKIINEKDIALSLSKLIHKKLLNTGINAFLTRSMDRDVSLDERAELAQRLSPDIYISIHMNASTENSSNGLEVYYLDNHNSVAVKRVEEIENRDLKGDSLVVNQILLDLVIERTATKSKELAKSIHKKVVGGSRKKFKFADRGVRPALFYVLALSKRPSVLLEVGFMTNEKELQRLLDKKFQEEISNDIVKGIQEYFHLK